MANERSLVGTAKVSRAIASTEGMVRETNEIHRWLRKAMPHMSSRLYWQEEDFMPGGSSSTGGAPKRVMRTWGQGTL